MNPLRLGVVGIGYMGIHHVRICSELDSCQLTAIFDIDRTITTTAARKYRIHAASSLEDFANRVDAATICTPTVTHFEIGQFLLKRGKHLLVEKPIAENSERAHALALIAQEKQCILQIGHIERFNPVLETLERNLNNPRFLEVTRLSPYPNRSTDIGVVLDLMIHDIEIILHLVRSPVMSIDPIGIAVLSKSEDIANVRFHFESGCVANVSASRISHEKVRKIRIFQEDAYLSLDYQKQTGKMYRLVNGKIVKDRVKVARGEPLKSELAAFISCAQDGSKPRVTGYEAAAALDIALEITRRIEAADPRQNNRFVPHEKNLGSGR